MRLAVLIAVLAAAACAPVPPVDVARFEARVPPARPGFPALAPIAAVVEGTGGPNLPDPQAAGLTGRAGGLRARASALAGPVGAAAEPARAEALGARAEALAGPVIPPDERERLEDAVP